MVGYGASLDGRLFLGGTDGSNPVPSSGESANHRFAHGAFQGRIFQAPAEHIEEKQVLAFDPPRRTHREIAELGGFVGGVPALHDAIEALRPY